MQDYNYQRYYHSQDSLDLLDDKSDEDESEDGIDKKNEEPDPDFQDLWIVLVVKNALKTPNHLLKDNINLEIWAQDWVYN